MHLANLSLSDRFRPTNLVEVVGAPPPLSKLIEDSKQGGGRSVLIAGPTGCGKSLIAQIYAKALLCRDVVKPCNHCDDCLEFEEGSHRNFRAAIPKTSPDEVASEIDHTARDRRAGGGRLVIYVDQVDYFSKAAIAILTAQLEPPPPETTYIFCSQRAAMLPEELTSRLFPIAVSQPSLGNAHTYLDYIAGKAGIDFEDAARETLASEFRTSYRKLAWAIEQCLDNRLVSTATVLTLARSSMQAVQVLNQTFRKVALKDQFEEVRRWSLPHADQILAIARCIAILNRRGSIEAIRMSELYPLWSEIEQSYEANIAQGDAEIIASLAKIWQSVDDATELTMQLKLAETRQLLNVLAPEKMASARSLAHSWKVDDAIVEDLRTRARKPRRERTLPPPTNVASLRYLKVSEAEKLWETGSFLIQNYGRYFNSLLTIHHGLLTLKASSTPAELVRDLLHGFGQNLGRENFYWVLRHRADATGTITEVAISATISDARVLGDWLAKFFSRRCTKTPIDGSYSLDADNGGSNELERHRRLTRLLCNALPPTKKGRQLLRQMRISASDNIGLGEPGALQSVSTSHNLGPSAKRAAEEVIPLVSAFIDGADDWEMQEFRYRTALQAQFDETVSDLLGSDATSKRRLSEFLRRWNETQDERIKRRPTAFHNSRKATEATQQVRMTK